MIDIYYPYLQQAAIGEELKYSLRSLQQNARFDYRVCIVGDLPSWCTNVLHIPHTYDPNPPAPATFDAISKLELFLKATNRVDQPEEFIRMYDDVLLLKPCTLEDMRVFYTLGDYSRKEPASINTWGRQLRATFKTLRDAGYTQYHTETHLPELFHKTRMEVALEVFEAKEKRLLSSTLYANSCNETLTEINPQAGAFFWGLQPRSHNTGDLEDIRKICAPCRYLNYNDTGYTAGMKAYLAERFPLKSRFEI